MTQAHGARGALTLFAVALTMAGCGGASPTAVPYVSLGRDLAGVYNPSEPSTSRNMRLVLGTRHNLTGRYENSAGDDVRFEGTWERLRNGTLVLMFDGHPGLPADVALQVSSETVVTEIPPSPFAVGPPGPPLFRTQEFRRLHGEVDIEGTLVELDLFRIITTIGAGNGGQTAN